VGSHWGADPPAEAGLLTPAEVAELFGVDPKSVAKWARDRVLPSIRTPGGTHRYRETDVQALLKESRAKYGN
jgi:excisionase family DNA binding protein